MTANWERVTAIFGAARVLGAADQKAFLDASCSSDAALRAEVESLLGSDGDDSFLERPPEAAARIAMAGLANWLASGQVLKGRYRIEAPLGAGGQSLVYRATDQLLSRAVVVKVMRTAGPRNQWLKSRFEREMEALARIDHPGVVGILDVGDLPDGDPFLVIQHIDGVTLRALLADGPLGVSRATAILRQLGAALGAAHAVGVAHQDVKPENIMLQRLDGGGETLRLIDFGIAKVERSQREAGVTTVMLAGTVRYMAPEQFQGEHSPACDVYALGLVACEMLCGQPDARALGGRVSTKAGRLIDQALAFRPEDRPADVKRWCHDLAEALLHGDGLRRRVIVVAATGAVVVVASVAGARALLTNYSEPSRVVQKAEAFDPLQAGFLPHNQVTGTFAPNPERNASDGWRIFGSGPGDYYYSKLTSQQKALALDRGWTLSVHMRAEAGLVFAGLDLAGHGKRFDIVVHREYDEDLVRLYSEVVPKFQGLDFRMPHLQGGYHHYELRYLPGPGSAELWVDGLKRLGNFKGLGQFQDDIGVFFGAAPYKSEMGAGSFRAVRFEINP